MLIYSKRLTEDLLALMYGKMAFNCVIIAQALHTLMTVKYMFLVSVSMYVVCNLSGAQQKYILTSRSLTLSIMLLFSTHFLYPSLSDTSTQ